MTRTTLKAYMKLISTTLKLISATLREKKNVTYILIHTIFKYYFWPLIFLQIMKILHEEFNNLSYQGSKYIGGIIKKKKCDTKFRQTQRDTASISRPSKCPKLYTNRILGEQNLRKKVREFFQNLNHDKMT